MPTPDFMVIGASRSGTSSMFLNLVQHPQILKPHCKEIHYFDNHLWKGESWYLGLFPRTADGELTFDATPNYLYKPTAPKLIREFDARHNLNLRFIVLMRNPIDRTWSHFEHCKHAVRAKNLAIERSESRRQPFVIKSIYIEQIKRWLRHYDQSRFLFIRSEDFFGDERGVCKAVFRWLGVDEIVLSKIKYYDPWKPNKYKKTKYSKCPPHVRKQLAEFFEPYNQQLYEFMGFDFGWK